MVARPPMPAQELRGIWWVGSKRLASGRERSQIKEAAGVPRRREAVRYRVGVSIRALFALLALTGCGRVGFGTANDASPDACGSHDEDSDGVPDCADHCPHVSDPLQPDGDGDGVGDGCDPHPTVARDHLVHFDPLTSPPADWLVAPAVATGESLMIDATNVRWAGKITITPASDTFVMGGAVFAYGSGADHQVAIIVNDYPRAYYCELYQANRAQLNFTYTFDSVGFTTVSSSAIAAFDNSAFQLILQHEPTTTLCTAIVNQVPTAAGGTNPAIVANKVSLQLYQLAARLDYVVVIHSD